MIDKRIDYDFNKISPKDITEDFLLPFDTFLNFPLFR